MAAGLLTTMKNILRKTFIICSVSAGLALVLSQSACRAAELSSPDHQIILASYSEINLDYAGQNLPLYIPIKKEQSELKKWREGQRIAVRAFVVHADGQRERVRDTTRRTVWEVTLNSQKEASLWIQPDPSTFTGRVLIEANKKKLQRPENDRSASEMIEKVREYRCEDGARIKVHYTDQGVEENHGNEVFARDVLDAAVQAYRTITGSQGFRTQGYAFANPDKQYAYDPDQTIDIYVGNPADDARFPGHGFHGMTFKDAPCFDTIRRSENAYDAVILLPSNYKDFIRNWERINPSSLGKRNVEVDLRGTLMHEMLHVVLFYYNRNLKMDPTALHAESTGAASGGKVDWYVEGLARYFETFAGAQHDFFSQGFKQTLPDKIRFSRGGSNYFMRYPDQAFTELRYENALFWRFIDTRYGMNTIEKLSRGFRDRQSLDFKTSLEQAIGEPFDKILKHFALAILFKDFDLKENGGFLNTVATTKLTYHDGALHLVDGYGNENTLGDTCAVDWIGQWMDVKTKLGDAPAAGDNTLKADVSGWATDFQEIGFLPGGQTLPTLGVRHKKGGTPLLVQCVIVSRSGSHLTEELAAIHAGESQELALEPLIKRMGWNAGDVEKVTLLITNTDPEAAADYEVTARA